MECQIKEVRKSYYKLERFRKGDDDKDLTVKGKNIYLGLYAKIQNRLFDSRSKNRGGISTEELLCLEGETQQPLHQRSWTI